LPPIMFVFTRFSSLADPYLTENTGVPCPIFPDAFSRQSISS
jgi:hypothetical protein